MTLLKLINQNKPEFVILVLLIFGSLLLSAGFTLPIKPPDPGNDLVLHIKYAQSYVDGHVAAFEDQFKTINSAIPYPPFFHFLLALFILLGILYPAITFFQLISYTAIMLALFTAIYLITKNIKLATLSSIIFVSCPAIFDRTMQFIPQTVDFFCFPLALYFFWKKKEWLFLLFALISVWNHSGYGLVMLGAFVLYSLQTKQNIGFIKKALLLASPIIIITILYLPNAFTYASNEANPQNVAMKAFYSGNFSLFGSTYLGFTILFLLFPALLFLIWKNKLIVGPERYLGLLCTNLLFLSLLMIVFFADRATSYSALPASVLISLALISIIKKRIVIIYFLLLCLVILTWFAGIQFFLK